jgi:hypothetical protein
MLLLDMKGSKTEVFNNVCAAIWKITGHQEGSAERSDMGLHFASRFSLQGLQRSKVPLFTCCQINDQQIFIISHGETISRSS